MMVAGGLLVAGCSTLPQSNDALRLDRDDEARQETSSWESIAPLSVVPITGEPVLRMAAGLPAEIGRKEINIEAATNVSMAGFMAILNAAGFPALVSEAGLQDTTVWLPLYRGPLSGLLDSVGQATGVAFEWRGGAIVAAASAGYVAHLPQDKKLIAQVSKEITSLGATDVVASPSSGSVNFRADAARAAPIREYLSRTLDNAAMVGLQVAVITVALDRNVKTGIDWGNLQALVGANAFELARDAVTGANAGIGNTGNTGLAPGGLANGTGGYGTPGSVPNVVVAPPSGEAIGLSGQGVAFRVERGSFSINSFISLLSSYGNSRAAQNLILRTLSGNPVKIRSGESVPYISGVSLGALGNSTLSTNSIMGTTSVEKAETGLTLKIEPRYDYRANLVTLSVKIKLSSILRFIELSAGNQIGTLSQPDIQEQEFNNVARVRAGDTLILGGLVFDQTVDSRSTLAGLESVPIGSKDSKVVKSALIIVLRPTVTAYAYR